MFDRSAICVGTGIFATLTVSSPDCSNTNLTQNQIALNVGCTSVTLFFVGTVMASALCTACSQWQIGGGAIVPHKMARKIFLSVSENKSSDRKLSLIPFVSAAPVWLNSDFEGLRTF